MERPALQNGQRNSDFEDVQWQWQSDPNPYQEADFEKWNWQNFPDDENLMIEDAFNLNQEIVTLKDYEIDLKKMLQVSLKDRNKIRRVRRQEPSRLMMKIPKIVVKDQKTMNEAFGTVQQFLEYIMKRTPEAYSLYQKLRPLSIKSNRSEFEDLIGQVLTCIEKGAEARAKIIQTRIGSCRAPPNYILEVKKLMEMIQNNSKTLDDFLNSVLKAYTMESFLCYWLNDLLRNENWGEINVLTPYIVCLVYKFKLSDQMQRNPSSINRRLGFDVKHRLNLFRGTALTEKQLASYNPNQIKYFAWNAVTSTSRDRNVAQKFVDLSLTETNNLGVIFSIEIEFESIDDYHGVIDISKDSKYPHEKEVILAPGTVFKLLGVSLVENDVYEIRLKVTKNVQEAQEDVVLLGVLQDEGISEARAVIDGLPSQQALKMFDLLRGNKLIRQLEIRKSGLEEQLLEEIEDLRKTTNVRREDIKLVDNTIVVGSLALLVYYFSVENLNEILEFNQVRFAPETSNNNHQIILLPELRIKDIVLSDKTIENFCSNNQLKQLWNALKSENEMKSISISLVRQMEDGEADGLFECIKERKSLEDLSLVFGEISIESLSFLCQGISESVALNRISLKFPCSDEWLSFLKDAFRPLESLQSLSLSFSERSKFSDEGMVSFRSALMSLGFLQSLSLEFEGSNFSNKGLNDLTIAIESLTFLQNLHFGLKGCDHITDFGFKHLKNVLIPLTELQNLAFHISACSQISEGCLHFFTGDSLFSKYLRQISVDIQIHLSSPCYIKSIQISKLSLDLKFCNQIEDRHFDFFKKSFPSFQRLFLDLKSCDWISDQELHDFATSLASSSSLQGLSLQLKNCKKVSDSALESLSNALASQKSLQRLSLGFGNCEKISDKGLDHLKSSFEAFRSLKCLFLDFGGCHKISDLGLNKIKSTFSCFTEIQTLCLSFASCSEISNFGLYDLKNALITLTTLQHLFLDFRNCPKISNLGLDHLRITFLSTKSLQYLSLNLQNCKEVSDEGLYYLKLAIQSLTSLQFLSLCLSGCSGVSDQGVEYLGNAITSLTSLQHLSLGLTHCPKISNQKRIREIEGKVNAAKALIPQKNLLLDASGSCKCPKILIVDDNPFNLLVLKNLLRSSDFESDYASNGQDAIYQILERIKTRCGMNCQPYQVVFMDDQMPVMDGFEATKKLKHLQRENKIPEMAIVGISVNNSEDAQQEWVEAGSHYHITKPVKSNDLEKILKELGSLKMVEKSEIQIMDEIKKFTKGVECEIGKFPNVAGYTDLPHFPQCFSWKQGEKGLL